MTAEERAACPGDIDGSGVRFVGSLVRDHRRDESDGQFARCFAGGSRQSLQAEEFGLNTVELLLLTAGQAALAPQRQQGGNLPA